MNPPAKKALGRSIGDTVLAGLALLLFKYFGPEPHKAPKPMDTDGVMNLVTTESVKVQFHVSSELRKVVEWVQGAMAMIFVVLILLIGMAVIPSKQENFNAMPPPIETPVVLFTRSGHWHKAVRDSLGVDRNYETWERINNATGWMKP